MLVENGQNNRAAQLIANLPNRSSWVWGIDQGVLWIEDIGGRNCRSLTNDMGNVLTEIALFLHNQKQKRLSDFDIIYMDSTSTWDGVKVKEEGTERQLKQEMCWKANTQYEWRSTYVQYEFYGIGKSSFAQAINGIRS